MRNFIERNENIMADIDIKVGAIINDDANQIVVMQKQLDKIAKQLKLNIDATVKGINGVSSTTNNSTQSTQKATVAMTNYEKALDNVVHKYKMKEISDDKFVNMSDRITKMAQFQTLEWKKQENYINLVAKAEQNYTKVRTDESKINDTILKQTREQVELQSKVRNSLSNQKQNEIGNAHTNALQINKQIDELNLYKQSMLGGNGFRGQLDVFGQKQKGNYVESLF